MQTVHVVDDYNLRQAKVVVHDTEAPTFEARLATILVEKWGMVAGAPDGEDSSGRAKLKLLAPQEVVDRACEVASLAISAFRDRGWCTAVPPFAELRGLADAATKQFEADAEERRAASRQRNLETS